MKYAAVAAATYVATILFVGWADQRTAAEEKDAAPWATFRGTK